MNPGLALTMGDPAGIGPELCLRALAADSVRAVCAPVVFGDAALLRRVAARTGLPFTAPVWSAADWAAGKTAEVSGGVVDCVPGGCADIVPGRVQAGAGVAAAACIEAAVMAVLGRRLAAVVTAPIHKEALRLAGVPYPGHTEMLAALTGASETVMTMAAPELVVGLVTMHRALREVPDGLTSGRILTVARRLDEMLRRLGKPRPVLAVCALNPHGGEHGLFGDEEERIIAPALRQAQREGLQLEGPLPPDTAFVPARRARTDAYVVMYHDQGLIPFKMLAFDHGVNITLGLPIVRVSVDHGTAFDQAWRGTASPRSLYEAVGWALRLSAPARSL